MADNIQKDNWDKVIAIAALIASILVPITLAFVGNAYSSAIKEAENRVKYTELAIGILKSPPTGDTQNIRSWAIDVINNYSGVPLNDTTKAELLKNNLAGRVDEFVSTKWVPVFSKNFVAEVSKNPEWKKAVSSGDPRQVEKLVEELVAVVAQQALRQRAELLQPLDELSESLTLRSSGTAQKRAAP